MFDDLTYARTIMEDREREAARARLARVARRAGACCETRLARATRLLARTRDTGPAPACAGC